MGNPLSLDPTAALHLGSGSHRDLVHRAEGNILPAGQAAGLDIPGYQPPAADPAYEAYHAEAMRSLLGHDLAPTRDPLAEQLGLLRLKQAGPQWEQVGQDYEQYPAQVPLGQATADAFGFGLRYSMMGSLLAYQSARQGFKQMGDDATFDPFSDPEIEKRGFGGQWHLFETSRSAEQNRWIMDRSEQRAKEAHYIDGLPGMNGVPAFLGGMAGDPLSYLPTVFKLAASSAAIRAGRGVRAAEDITQLGFKRPQLGFMGDAVQQAAIQTAMVVGQAGFQHSIDPTASIDDYMGLFMIPMALGASVGLLTHSYVALGRQINKLRPGTPGDLGDIGAPANEPRPPPGGGGPAAVSRETTPTGDPTLDLLKPGGLKTDYAEVNAANRVRVRIVTETDRLMRDPTFEQGKSAMERLDKAKEAAEKSVELTNQDDQNAVASKAFVEAELAQKHKPPPSTVGANLLNQSLLDREKILAGNRFVKVKWLPDLPMNPVFRTAAGNSIAAQEIVEGLVESGGLTRVKNLEGEAPGVPSTERTIQMNWTPPLVEALRGQLTEWRKAREGGGYVEKNDMMSLAQVPIAAVKDWTGNTGELSFEAFRRRVGDVQNTGDHDMVGDKYSPHVDAAAAAIRKVYDKTGKEAMDSGLFQDSAEKTIAQRTARQQILTKELHDLEDKIDELKAHRDPVGNARYEKAQARMEELPGLIERTGQQIKTLSQQLDRLRSGNLDANETQTTYRPRVWLAGKIMNNAEAVKDIFRNYLKGGGLDGERLDRAVDDVFLTVTKQQPLYLRGDIDQLFQGVADPMSAHGITFRIPDALVKDYIENDSELLLRHHVRQMGAAIEMKKRWGSTDLADEIQQIRDEGERFKLDPKEIDQHIEDVTALRDRLYGTYGAAADPHRLSSRIIRTAKEYSNLTTLGMSGFNSLADLIRPALTEGYQALHQYGLKSFIEEAGPTIRKLASHEMEKFGDAVELWTSMRSMSAADSGDMFMKRTSFERAMNKMNATYFLANGLNLVNQADKFFGGMIAMGRVNDELMKLVTGGEMHPQMVSRLAVSGIDLRMRQRIAGHVAEHGIQFNSIRMPNTDAWKDPEAELAYGTAIVNMTNRTVPTPGLGDRPLFMSTELGSLLTQYRAFSVGTTIRNLYAGLQEPGNNLWQGLAIMVGGSILLNELRSQLFNNRSTFDKPLTAIIADGVDRSSVLGIFGDAGRTVGILSNHNVGLPTVLGGDPAHHEGIGRKVGSLLGPAAGQGATAGSVVADLLYGHPTAETFRNARGLVPYNQTGPAKMVFDKAQKAVRHGWQSLGLPYDKGHHGAAPAAQGTE